MSTKTQTAVILIGLTMLSGCVAYAPYGEPYPAAYSPYGYGYSTPVVPIPVPMFYGRWGYGGYRGSYGGHGGFRHYGHHRRH